MPYWRLGIGHYDRDRTGGFSFFCACFYLLAIVPQDLTPLKRTLDNIKDPLFRYFEREVSATGTSTADSAAEGG